MRRALFQELVKVLRWKKQGIVLSLELFLRLKDF